MRPRCHGCSIGSSGHTAAAVVAPAWSPHGVQVPLRCSVQTPLTQSELNLTLLRCGAACCLATYISQCTHALQSSTAHSYVVERVAAAACAQQQSHTAYCIMMACQLNRAGDPRAAPFASLQQHCWLSRLHPLPEAHICLHMEPDVCLVPYRMPAPQHGGWHCQMSPSCPGACRSTHLDRGVWKCCLIPRSQVTAAGSTSGAAAGSPAHLLCSLACVCVCAMHADAVGGQRNG